MERKIEPEKEKPPRESSVILITLGDEKSKAPINMKKAFSIQMGQLDRDEMDKLNWTWKEDKTEDQQEPETTVAANCQGKSGNGGAKLRGGRYRNVTGRIRTRGGAARKVPYERDDEEWIGARRLKALPSIPTSITTRGKRNGRTTKKYDDESSSSSSSSSKEDDQQVAAPTQQINDILFCESGEKETKIARQGNAEQEEEGETRQQQALIDDMQDMEIDVHSSDEQTHDNDDDDDDDEGQQQQQQQPQPQQQQEEPAGTDEAEGGEMEIVYEDTLTEDIVLKENLERLFERILIPLDQIINELHEGLRHTHAIVSRLRRKCQPKHLPRGK